VVRAGYGMGITPSMMRELKMVMACESCQSRHGGKHVVSKFSPEKNEDGRKTRDCIYCGLAVPEDLWTEYDPANEVTHGKGTRPSGACSGGCLRDGSSCSKCGEAAVWRDAEPRYDIDDDGDTLIRRPSPGRCRACGYVQE